MFETFFSYIKTFFGYNVMTEEDYWAQYDSLDSEKEEFIGYDARYQMYEV